MREEPLETEGESGTWPRGFTKLSLKAWRINPTVSDDWIVSVYSSSARRFSHSLSLSLVDFFYRGSSHPEGPGENTGLQLSSVKLLSAGVTSVLFSVLIG